MGAIYKICHEYKYTPDYVESLPFEKFLYLVAEIAPNTPAKIERGGSILKAWVAGMQKAKKGQHGPKRS